MQDPAVGTIVLPEAVELASTLTLIKHASQRIEAAATSGVGTDLAYRYGRLLEALDLCDHALFNAISTASSYLDCSVSRRVIAVRHGKALGLTDADL